MMNMSFGEMGSMMLGMGVVGILIVVAFVLVVAAAIKILFFNRHRDKR